MKIDLSVFIKDLMIDKGLIKYNGNIISIKTGLVIEMLDLKDKRKTDLYKYQQLIGKLIYLVCEIKPNILFIVGQFSKYNANSRKSHLQVIKRII